VSVLVSLNEAVLVAGTLVMQSCTGDSSYFIRCSIHRPTQYSYSAGFGATTCRLWKWLEQTSNYWTDEPNVSARYCSAELSRAETCGAGSWAALVADAAHSGPENRTETEIAVFSLKPNRNRPTSASIKP